MATKPTKKQAQVAAARVEEANGNLSKQLYEQMGYDDPSLAQQAANAGVATLSLSDDGSVSTYAITEDSAAFGEFVMTYSPTDNPYLVGLPNRIFAEWIWTMDFQNPFSRFDKGMLEMGDTIEEIFVQIAKGYRFDPEDASKTLFKRHLPDVRVAFHKLNFFAQYPMTINMTRVRRAFVSWAKVDELNTAILNSMYQGWQVDKYNLSRYALALAILRGDLATVVVTDPDTDDSWNKAYRTLQTLADNIWYPSPEYNAAGVFNNTPDRNKLMIETTEMRNAFNIETRAQLYNLSVADYREQQFSIKDFKFLPEEYERLKSLFTDPETGEVSEDYHEFTSTEQTTLDSVIALVGDDRWFQNYTQEVSMDSVWNAKGKYWNYFYTIIGAISESPFANMVVVTSEATTITDVTVSPTSSTVSAGDKLLVTATVTGTGAYDKTCAWTLVGSPTSSETKLVPMAGGATLYVGKGETATSLTVRATAANNDHADCAVTVTPAASD